MGTLRGHPPPPEHTNLWQRYHQTGAMETLSRNYNNRFRHPWSGCRQNGQLAMEIEAMPILYDKSNVSWQSLCEQSRDKQP